MALRYDLVVDQGSDYERFIPIYDGNGDLANVTGWGVVGQIRTGNRLTDTLLHTLSLTPSGTNVRLFIPAAVSSAWAFQLARYDVELTAPNTTVTRVLEGYVIIRPEITHN